MKKLLSFMAAIALMLTLSACTGEEEETTSGFELALVTDVGTIDDKSFNQGAWEGLEQYALENNITHKYYQPASQGDAEYMSSIELAVEGGAKVIVLPGFLFEVAAYEVQDKYPEVSFILIDGTPHTADYSTFKTGDNLVSIKYQEEVSGYMAGYAAVMDGYTNLGFIGGMAVPAVQLFGIGYVQGADAAAKELGLTDVTMKYHYAGSFNPSPEAKTLASSWYSDGVEVIFSCAGGLGTSVIAAAEETADKMIIGVDVDQSSQSTKNKVLTSAAKGLTASVYDAIAAYYAGDFPGGENLVLGLEEDGVEIEMENSNFNTFSNSDYETLKNEIMNGTKTVSNEFTREDVSTFATSITVNVIE